MIVFYVEFRRSNIKTFPEIRNVSEMLNQLTVRAVLFQEEWIIAGISFHWISRWYPKHQYGCASLFQYRKDAVFRL